MFKHELANGVNNLHQLGMSSIDNANLEEGVREDLKYDHLEAFDVSQLTLNKLHTLLYTSNIPKSKKIIFPQIFETARKALPLNPAKINLVEENSSQDRLFPSEATTQILYGIFQLIIRNEQDSFDNGIKIAVSNTDAGSIEFSYSGANRSDLFNDLAKGAHRFKKKSKMALEYEFLRHLISHEVIILKPGNSSLSVQFKL